MVYVEHQGRLLQAWAVGLCAKVLALAQHERDSSLQRCKLFHRFETLHEHEAAMKHAEGWA